jgi:hypothetical protein
MTAAPIRLGVTATAIMPAKPEDHKLNKCEQGVRVQDMLNGREDTDLDIASETSGLWTSVQASILRVARMDSMILLRDCMLKKVQCVEGRGGRIAGS